MSPAKTTSKLCRLRILHFQLALLLCILWVTLNQNSSKVARMTTDALRHTIFDPAVRTKQGQLAYEAN
jgi:hypothetical protein